MDYKEFVRKHRESGAAITIAALPCDEARASAFGLMKIDDEGRVTEFAEKPKGDALTAMKVDTTILGTDEKTCARGGGWQRAGQHTQQHSQAARLLGAVFDVGSSSCQSGSAWHCTNRTSHTATGASSMPLLS